jgi:hypothetical protein
MKQIILIVYFALACSASSFANLRLLTSSFTHPDLAKWAAENPLVLENFTKQDFIGLPVKNDNDYEEAKTEANKIANAHGFLVFSFDAYALAPESDSMFRAKVDAKIKSTLGYNYQGAYIAFLMLRESLDDNSFLFQSVINWANYGRSNILTEAQKNSIANNTEEWAKKIFEGDFSQRIEAAARGTKKLKELLDEDPEAYFLINLKKFKQNETVFVPTNVTLEVLAFRSDGTPVDITEWSKIGNITPLLNKDIKNKAVFKMFGSSKDETGDELNVKGINDYHCSVRIVSIDVSLERLEYDNNKTEDNQDVSALDINREPLYPSFYANSYFQGYKGRDSKYYNNSPIGIPYQFIPKGKSVVVKIRCQPELKNSNLICTVGNTNLFDVSILNSKNITCKSKNLAPMSDTASLFFRIGNADGFLLGLGILQSHIKPPNEREKRVKFYVLEDNKGNKMKHFDDFVNKSEYFIKQPSLRYYQPIGIRFKLDISNPITIIKNVPFDTSNNGKLDIIVRRDTINNTPDVWSGEAQSVVDSLKIADIHDLSIIHIVLFDETYMSGKLEGAGLRGNAVFFMSFKHICGNYVPQDDDKSIIKTIGHEVGHILGLRHPFDKDTKIFKGNHIKDNSYVCKDCRTVFKKAINDPLNIMDYGPSLNLLFRKYQWDILYNLMPISEQ